MARTVIRDSVLWTRQIADDAEADASQLSLAEFWDSRRLYAPVTIEAAAVAERLTMTALLAEWGSPEDAAAYDGL